jgi:prevent-host-death family protein
MESVSVQELRNHGGEVLDRVARGAAVVVTRDGVEVAELRPLRRRGVAAAELIARHRHLPDMDPEALRHDIDDVLESGLGPVKTVVVCLTPES